MQNYFTPNDAIVLLIIDTFFYIVLYFYLDEIIPNEYGVSKHPLFFIKDLFKSKRSRSNSFNNRTSKQPLKRPLMGESLNRQEDEEGSPSGSF